MKSLSFQWRITLMTAFLIAMTCITLNLLLYYSGSYHFDTLADSLIEYNDAEDVLNNEENVVVIDMTPEEFNKFYDKFSADLSKTKSGFSLNGWIITFLVTLISSIIAYFVSGLSLRPLKDFSEQVEQVHVKNLTEIRLKEDTTPEFQVLSRSLNRMLERLSDAFKTQKQFAGNAAHELRTPLALMQAKLDFYQSELHSSSPETKDTIATLSEQTDRLSNMVKTLLSMSDLETIPRNEKVQLAPLIEEVLTDLAPLAEKKNITLLQDGENITLTGSDILLYRLIFNLVENGIKYNHPEGSVTVSVAAENFGAVIRVSDTGQGIPKEHLENVFQPFFRVDKSRSRSMGSVGLGLSLVSEVVRLHGGSIHIESIPQEGTIFVVHLPIADSDI